MKQKEVKIISLGVGGRMHIKDIPNTLEAKQKEVGGYIEIPWLGEKFAEMGIDLVVDEEGKLKVDPVDWNRNTSLVFTRHETGEILDIVLKDCFFVGNDGNGDHCSLTPKQVEFIANRLKFCGKFYNMEL